MRTVHKQVLSAAKTSYLVPDGAEVLCVQVQGEDACIWYLCDPKQPLTSRTIIILGTGHEVDEKALGRYLGTFQLMEGRLVLHVFEGVFQ